MTIPARSLLLIVLVASVGCTDTTPPPAESHNAPVVADQPKPAEEAKPKPDATAATKLGPAIEVAPAASAAAPPATADLSGENPVLIELVEKGIQMPDGTVIKLPAPTLGNGMDATAQKAAIKKIMPKNCTYEDFTDSSTQAPFGLKKRTPKGKAAKDKQEYTFRTVDLGFVAHGRWDVLNSDKFADGFTKPSTKANTKNQGGALKKSGFLSKEEMAKRSLQSLTKKGQEDRYFFSTFSLFDMVEVSATRYAVLSKTPSTITLAARLDPRFVDDAEYPNQWQPIDKDALGNPVLGKKQPYSGAGFYLKITRLSEPADAIFIEFHSAFNEPQGWFDGQPMLFQKLGTIAKFQVEQFRGKLARASVKKEEEGEKKAEK